MQYYSRLFQSPKSTGPVSFEFLLTSHYYLQCIHCSGKKSIEMVYVNITVMVVSMVTISNQNHSPHKQTIGCRRKIYILNVCLDGKNYLKLKTEVKVLKYLKVV